MTIECMIDENKLDKLASLAVNTGLSIKTGQDCIFKTHLLKDQTEYNKENLIGYARISVNRLDDD